MTHFCKDMCLWDCVKVFDPVISTKLLFHPRTRLLKSTQLQQLKKWSNNICYIRGQWLHELMQKVPKSKKKMHNTFSMQHHGLRMCWLRDVVLLRTLLLLRTLHPKKYFIFTPIERGKRELVDELITCNVWHRSFFIHHGCKSPNMRQHHANK